MKASLLTTITWLALVQVLVLVNHSFSALATVNLTESNGSTPYVVLEPEIPYEELEEPRVLPLQALPITVKASTSVPPTATVGGFENSQELFEQRQHLLNDAPDQPPHADVNTVLKVILEEQEINDEPFTTTHGYPTFSADDNFGNCPLFTLVLNMIINQSVASLNVLRPAL